MRFFDVLKLILLHLSAVLLGGILFAASFSTPIFQNMDVFFYRGAALLLLVGFLIGCAWLALKIFSRRLRRLITIRDVLLNVCIILSLYMLFFTHVPVTADRSISIFVLGSMAENPDHIFTEKEIEDFFIQRYVQDYGAFAKRFHEQAATGTVRAEGNGYVLTERGRGLIRFYDFIADCFHIDKKLIYPGREGG
jgi:hypothetical protein